MSGRLFRFLHASDLHLETPVIGAIDVPDHLRDAVVDAPYDAATRLFTAALDRQVDFVILAGDVADLHGAGPCAAVFLAGQFERLAAKNIAVYWLEGGVDRASDWPADIELPANVRFLDGSLYQGLDHQRDGQTVAKIVPVENFLRPLYPAGRPASDSENECVIAIAYGEPNAEVLEATDVTYWALGGKHGRKTLSADDNDSSVAHYPGSPQGRCFNEGGHHGATLVDIGSQRHCQLETLALDAIVWVRERIELDERTSPEEFTESLALRTTELIEQFTDRPLMISWEIEGSEYSGPCERRGNIAELAVRHLQKQFGYNQPAAWTIDIQWESASRLPSDWYEEDSMRGEFLQQIEAFKQNADELLSLDALAAAVEIDRQLLDPAVASMLSTGSSERLLQQAAGLGADLLSGPEHDQGNG